MLKSMLNLENKQKQRVLKQPKAKLISWKWSHFRLNNAIIWIGFIVKLNLVIPIPSDLEDEFTQA